MVTIASPKKLSGLSESFSRPSSLPPPCEVHKYVENWLEKVSSDRDPYSEEGFSDKSPPQEKVQFQIGGDSEENENDELCQSIVEQNAQHVTGLCAPPSSIRDGRAEHQEITLQTCIFAEAILSADHDAASAASKEKIKPIMQHICSAVQSIKRASDTNTPPSPDKTNSMDKFSNQVASVFGSSCKLFLSFLSVIILQDCITGGQSWGASEATMMMESLQKVSAAEDEEKQRVGLEDLRNKASFQLKKSWKDFMNLSDKTETETEITLSVKGVDVFEDQCLIIDELMGELNISQDLREVISSTVRLAPSFYPVEESTSLETEINQPDNANESEMGEEAGQGEVRDQMIANVQEEWETENDEQVGEDLKQEMVVEVHHQWGKVKGRGTEESQGSEEELLEETEEEESNEETDEREAVEETEMEGDAFTEATEEGDEVEERLIGGTEDISEKDEIQTEGEDISDSGEEPVVFTGKEVVDNDNDQQGEEKVIEEKREEAEGENKKEDEVVEEGGQESAGDNYSMTTCQGEDEQESDQSIEQEGRYEDRKEVDEEGLDEDRESEVGLEEANVPNEAAEDLDMKINERANSDSKLEQTATEFPVKYSSEEHCEDDKGNGADTMTDDGEEHCDDRSNNLPHPVEISQELLDFVNSALQSSSLIFTYDAQGNVWLEPDNCRVVKTKQALIPKRSKDSQYGLKILPSPSTSDLSDYRPETSESWRSNPQESTDMATDSGEDTLERSVISKNKGETHCQKTNAEPANTGSSAEAFQNPQVESRGTISSFSSGIETPRESPPQAATEDIQCTSASLVEESPDGVLIDQGRWLLKENHLIRKSPPFSSGMYDNADSTSIDSGQENGEDTVTHTQAQLNPLTYFSSSEIEEMAKPKTPKCTYYKMPHGSDSDPFIDDGSLKSEKNATSGSKRRGFRVSPTIDTSKTWASKNGSLSSFTSVEFKMSDRKVHPEEESSAVVQARRTSSGGRRELQAQDSQDTLNLRCSPYCPIL